MRDPRLRTANKVPAPFPLNEFPNAFLVEIAKELIAAKYARRLTDFVGEEWERAFARAIDAEWTPSNIGLDDVRKSNCCWGAKTVKNVRPFTAKSVRLISGRNSLDYSFDEPNPRSLEPEKVGQHILQIWNSRVASIRSRFEHARTVVLMKGPGLFSNAVFEFETIMYDPKEFVWSWNANNNLTGLDSDGKLRFTWQPHGAQFTISEQVPTVRHKISINPPEELESVETNELLDLIKFHESWITISK